MDEKHRFYYQGSNSQPSSKFKQWMVFLKMKLNYLQSKVGTLWTLPNSDTVTPDSLLQLQVTAPSSCTSGHGRQNFLLNTGSPLLNLKWWPSTVSTHSWWGGYTTVSRLKPTGFGNTATSHIALTLVFRVLAPRMPLCSHFRDFWSCKFHARHFHSHKKKGCHVFGGDVFTLLGHPVPACPPGCLDAKVIYAVPWRPMCSFLCLSYSLFWLVTERGHRYFMFRILSSLSALPNKFLSKASQYNVLFSHCFALL